MDHSGIPQIFPALVLLIIIPIVLLMVALQIIAFWKICTRIGLHGALGLLVLVPLGRIILPLYIAFAKWPALEQRSKETTESL